MLKINFIKHNWWKIVCIIFLFLTFTAGFLIRVPYVGNLYESIRNFFFHVPMWFGMILLFLLSVYYAVLYLRNPNIDYDRKSLHVVQGKGRKDRYVPLSDHLIRGLKKYILAEQPQEWLFNGKPDGRAGGDFDGRYSQRGVQWAVKQAKKAAGIIKDINVHTLRHTFATHLLEDGLDIMSIKDLLGHECIDTTLVYLHIAQSGRIKPFSPLDTLYKKD